MPIIKHKQLLVKKEAECSTSQRYRVLSEDETKMLSTFGFHETQSERPSFKLIVLSGFTLTWPGADVSSLTDHN
jgi:hypothetical protein